MKFQGTFYHKGMIITWNGSVASIPAGWVLCDGNNDTPDLTDKFIQGAGDTYAPLATGGAETHNHSGEATHSHNTVAGTGVAAGTDFNLETGAPRKPGTTGTAATIPPFMALCYIMKV